MNEQLSLPLPGLGRDWRQDAALRPRPKRDGPDNWAAPPCLLASVVWEPAPGDGFLACATNAHGSYFECVTRNRCSGHGCEILGCGSYRSIWTRM